MLQLTVSFKENLQLLPPVDGLARIELVDPTGVIVGTIENQPGKQGSLAVYHYLLQCFGTIDREAAAVGLDIFAEHTIDAKKRPGAHPNIDRLLAIVAGAVPLRIKIVTV